MTNDDDLPQLVEPVLPDEDEILLLAPAELPPGPATRRPSGVRDPFTQQKGLGLGFFGGGERRLKLNSLEEQIGRLQKQLAKVAASAQQSGPAPGYHLQEITFHLGISAKGRVALVAEGGLDASIELTWQRRPG